MTPGEIAFLSLVIAAFLTFGFALATVTHREERHRRRSNEPIDKGAAILPVAVVFSKKSTQAAPVRRAG